MKATGVAQAAEPSSRDATIECTASTERDVDIPKISFINRTRPRDTKNEAQKEATSAKPALRRLLQTYVCRHSEVAVPQRLRTDMLHLVDANWVLSQMERPWWCAMLAEVRVLPV